MCITSPILPITTPKSKSLTLSYVVEELSRPMLAIRLKEYTKMAMIPRTDTITDGIVMKDIAL